MSSRVDRAAALVATAVVIAAIVILVPSTSPSFERAEIYFAEGARTMLSSGDWVTPRYGGEVFFDKPPLVYWLQAVAFAVLGPTLAAARLPSMLAGVALCALVAWFGAVTYGRRVGRLAPLILLTAPGFWSMSRLAMSDATLALALAAALIAYQRGLTAASSGRRAIVIGHVATAVGLLAKGPVALALIGLAVIAMALLLRPLPLRRLFDPIALAAGLVVTGPWYVAVTIEHGRGFLDYFLLGENVSRFLGDKYSKPRDPTFYLGVLLSLYAPWSLWLAPALVTLRTRSRADDAERGVTRFLLGWVIAVLGFFSLSGFKLDYYLLPAYPALALLTAAGFDRLARSPDRLGRTVFGLGVATVVVTLAVGVLMSINAAVLFPEWSIVVAGLPGAAAAIGALGVGTALWARDRVRLPVAIAIASALLLVGGSQLVNAFHERHRPVMRFARLLATIPGIGDARVGTVMELAGEFHRVGFLSGLDARPLGDAAQVQRFATEAGRRFLILMASDQATLDLESAGGLQVLARGDDIDRSPARLDAFRRTSRVREVLLVEVVAPDDQSPSPSQDE